MLNPSTTTTRVAPAFHRQDTTKEVGNWSPMALTTPAGRFQCKDSHALKLGPSNWGAAPDKRAAEDINVISEVAPPQLQAEPAPVPFIDFLGVGAA